jgi:hypothetical protein
MFTLVRRKRFANGEGVFSLSRSVANVCFWHKADISRPSSDVRFWGVQRTSMDANPMSDIGSSRLLLRKLIIQPHFAGRKSLL